MEADFNLITAVHAEDVIGALSERNYDDQMEFVRLLDRMNADSEFTSRLKEMVAKL